MAIRKQSAHANSISINRVFFLGKAEIRTGTYIDKVDGKKNIIGLGVEENSNSKYKVDAIVNFNLNIDTNVVGNYDIKDKILINHDISSYKKVN